MVACETRARRWAFLLTGIFHLPQNLARLLFEFFQDLHRQRGIAGAVIEQRLDVAGWNIGCGLDVLWASVVGWALSRRR